MPVSRSAPRIAPASAPRQPVFALTLLLFALLGISPASAQPTPRPDVRIEYFGAERGYAIGMQSVTLLCVARNLGKAPLPANTLRVRLHIVAGLEFAPAVLAPALPELAPNRAVSFRWLVTPLQAQGPLVVAALLERNATATASERPAPGPRAENTAQTPAEEFSSEPIAVANAIPRFSVPLGFRPIIVRPTDPPKSRTSPPWIGNDRIGVQVLQTTNRNPTLALMGNSGKEWVALGFCPLPLEVRSAEEGQIPWAEAFRLAAVASSGDTDSATLTLTGSAGKRWDVEIVLEAPKFTGAIRGKIKLTARRTLRVFHVQLPAFLLAQDAARAGKPDGSALTVEETPSPLTETTPVAGSVLREFVTGIAWSNTAPVPDWRWQRLPTGDPQRAPLYGVVWQAPEKGDILSSGTSIEFAFRLIALPGAASALDLAPFALP